MNTVSRGVDREAAAFNLTPLEFALIGLLLVDLECTATGLTHMLSVNAPTISRVVNKLVDRGVLHRRRPRKDRRVVLLKLTEEGVALGLELHERAHSYEERLTRGISAEDQEVFPGHDQKNRGESCHPRTVRIGLWRPRVEESGWTTVRQLNGGAVEDAQVEPRDSGLNAGRPVKAKAEMATSE